MRRREETAPHAKCGGGGEGEAPSQHTKPQLAGAPTAQDDQMRAIGAKAVSNLLAKLSGSLCSVTGDSLCSVAGKLTGCAGRPALATPGGNTVGTVGTACSALEHVELAGSSDRAVGAEVVPPSGQVGSGKRRRPHPRARAQRAAQRVRRRTGVVALQHTEGVPPSGQVESEALADSQGHAVPSTCSQEHGGLDDGEGESEGGAEGKAACLSNRASTQEELTSEARRRASALRMRSVLTQAEVTSDSRRRALLLLLTTHYSLLTTYYLLPTTYYYY